MIFCISASCHAPKPFSASPCKKLGSRVGQAPEGAQFGFVFEELGQLAEQHLHELLRGHRRAVGMPERRDHHVLDRARLAVGQLHFDSLSLHVFGRLAHARPSTRRYRPISDGASVCTLRLRDFWLDRLAIPLRIAEMVVRLHEVVDREVVLAVVQPRAAPDDLLELDHRVDRPHQHNVADVPGIHAGREFLRRGQDRRDRLLVVLKVAQVLLAELAVVGRDPLAVVRVCARLHLIDEVAHGQRVILRGAEDQRLLLLVDLLHEDAPRASSRAP